MTKKKTDVFKIEDGGTITYKKNFMTKKEADDMFIELKEKVPWTQGVYKMFGKSVKTPRMLYAMRDKDLDISKSYSVTGSMEWLPSVELLKKRVEKATGKPITYCQLNYYRDGNDYIGYHTDSEIADGDIIASISLGATRKFVLRHKEYKTKPDIKKYNFNLENGSLFIMNDNAGKHYWKHALLKMKNVGPRINITFRNK